MYDALTSDLQNYYLIVTIMLWPNVTIIASVGLRYRTDAEDEIAIITTALSPVTGITHNHEGYDVPCMSRLPGVSSTYQN